MTLKKEKKITYKERDDDYRQICSVSVPLFLWEKLNQYVETTPEMNRSGTICTAIEMYLAFQNSQGSSLKTKKVNNK